MTSVFVSEASTEVRTCLSKVPGDAVVGEVGTGDLVGAGRASVRVVRKPVVVGAWLAYAFGPDGSPIIGEVVNDVFTAIVTAARS